MKLLLSGLILFAFISCSTPPHLNIYTGNSDKEIIDLNIEKVSKEKTKIAIYKAKDDITIISPFYQNGTYISYRSIIDMLNHSYILPPHDYDLLISNLNMIIDAFNENTSINNSRVIAFGCYVETGNVISYVKPSSSYSSTSLVNEYIRLFRIQFFNEYSTLIRKQKNICYVYFGTNRFQINLTEVINLRNDLINSRK